jgi:hypothetical protein
VAHPVLPVYGGAGAHIGAEMDILVKEIPFRLILTIVRHTITQYFSTFDLYYSVDTPSK